MSEVISFRLEKNNPREAQARAALKAWVDKGYSVRHVLTEALLAYQDSHRDMDIHELSSKLDQIRTMLLQNGVSPPLDEEQIELSDRFMASIKKAAKSGVSLG
jgi:hypothetical protein